MVWSQIAVAEPLRLLSPDRGVDGVVVHAFADPIFLDHIQTALQPRKVIPVHSVCAVITQKIGSTGPGSHAIISDGFPWSNIRLK